MVFSRDKLMVAYSALKLETQQVDEKELAMVGEMADLQVVVKVHWMVDARERELVGMMALSTENFWVAAWDIGMELVLVDMTDLSLVESWDFLKERKRADWMDATQAVTMEIVMDCKRGLKKVELLDNWKARWLVDWLERQTVALKGNRLGNWMDDETVALRDWNQVDVSDLWMDEKLVVQKD